MIGIRTQDGTLLDLEPGTSIRFSLVNPLYSGEIGFGSQSFSFNLPPTDKNRVQLGLKDITFVPNWDDLIDVTLELGGMPWAEATLEIEQVPNEGGWKATLFLDESRLAIGLNKLMREFQLGGERVISTETAAFDIADDVLAHANAAAAGSIDTFDYTFFPVRNTRKFYGGKNPEEDAALQTLYVNWWMDDSFWSRLGTTTMGGSPIDAVCNLVPMPYAIKLVELMVEEVGFSLAATTFSADPEIKTLTVYNTYAIDKLTLFGSPIVSVFGYYNWFQPTINLQNHVPQDITGADFIRGLMRFFGIVVKTDLQQVQLLSRNEVLNDNQEKDWKSFGVQYQWEKKEYEGFLFKDSLDGDDEFLNGDYLRSPADFTVAGEVDYYADLPINASIGSSDIYYVRNENAYYELVVTDAATETREWIRYSGRYDQIEVGPQDNKIEVVSQACTTMIFDGDVHSGYTWRTPWVQQLGSSPEYGLNRNPFALRFLFYRGLITDDPGLGAYPKAMPDDELGTYNYSLFWHGDRGRYETWWKRWTEFRQSTRPITWRLRLPFSEFFSLDPFKRVRLRTKDAEISGYWKQLDFTITPTGIGDVTMDMEAGWVAGLDLPVNITPPSIVGTTTTGETLTVVPGTWNQVGTLTYQWQLDGVDIPGETGTTYTLQSGDVGGMITVVETINGLTQATSAAVGPVLFSPASVAGLEAWWDVSDATARTLSGSNITGLTDKAGNSHNLLFTAGHAVLASAQFNGLDAAYFNVLGEAVIPFPHMDDFTFFIVWDSQDVGQPYPGPFALTNSTYTANSAYSMIFVSNNLAFRNGSQLKGQSFFSQNSETMPLALHGVIKNNALLQVQYLKDNTLSPVESINAAKTIQGFVLGGISQLSGGRHSGHICELLIYNSALSSSDVAAVQNYLLNKWGL